MGQVLHTWLSEDLYCSSGGGSPNITRWLGWWEKHPVSTVASIHRSFCGISKIYLDFFWKLGATWRCSMTGWCEKFVVVIAETRAVTVKN